MNFESSILQIFNQISEIKKKIEVFGRSWIVTFGDILKYLFGTMNSDKRLDSYDVKRKSV